MVVSVSISLLIFTTCVFAVLGRHVELEGNEGLYEGDIAVRTSFPPKANSSVKLGAIRDASKRWPGGKVPYRIDTDSIPNVKDQRLILEAMETLTNLVTCLQFQDNLVANKFDYVRIAGDGDSSHSSAGCWSYVGMQGGEQTLNLGSGCFTEELVLHELLHLLGIVHEQNRPDRDNFVEIMWSNIEPGMEGQFEKRNESEVTMQDTPYDFRSRMHYPAQAFSKSSAPTILARYPGDDNFGPVDKLSVTDVVEISLLYQCDISSGVAVKYSHVNRYANEVRIELVWEELDAMNSTTEDKFCEIDDKLEEMSTMLNSKDDKDNKCSDLELKVDSCDAQIQQMKKLFETNNNLVNKKIKEKDMNIERKLSEFVELFNIKNIEIEQQLKEKTNEIEQLKVKTNEIEQLKEKTNEIEKLKEKTSELEKETSEMKNQISSLEEENIKLNELNNQLKNQNFQLEDKISKIGDCKWSSWSEYSQCSVTHCGTDGIKTRTRSIQQPARNGGAQCSGEDSQALACGGCVPVLLHTDANYQYYKIPVLASSKMLSSLVLTTCTNHGMQPQCFRADYADKNCVQAPSTSIHSQHPSGLSKILCSTTRPEACASTLNMFWYMKDWYSGSACGATKEGGICQAGKDFTSTSNIQYFAACVKPV